MEYWDAYDEHMHRIKGVTLQRGYAVPDGMYHLVSDVLVRHADGSFLLTKRDPHKAYGGMWEASVGGSALRGESPYACAKRELKEESGISSGRLVRLATSTVRGVRTIFVGFLCETDCDKNDITLQEGETVDYRWVSGEELIAMRKRGEVTDRCDAVLHKILKQYATR